MTAYGANIRHLYAYRKEPHQHCGACHAPAADHPPPRCPYCGIRNWYERSHGAWTLREPVDEEIRRMIARQLALLSRQGWPTLVVVGTLLAGSCFPDPQTGSLHIWFATACAVLIDAGLGDALDTYKRRYPTAWKRAKEGRGIDVAHH